MVPGWKTDGSGRSLGIVGSCCRPWLHPAGGDLRHALQAGSMKNDELLAIRWFGASGDVKTKRIIG
jgi:hypothetical protein